ncbi:death domain-containing protein CRADD isoform X1 [Hippoglossus hippoglossus]|uniref:death domain-containing protein CRADD isoform X1 n=1 Tax=Hippoglossus hippoglossus TaxID=8267 RepID=UPI00148CF7E9|nr:death domain-containing protein CRADD isoform X1 [Hippoglossus hippoglossus]
MDPAHRAVLRRNTRFLSAELQVSDSIVPLLFQEEILTEAQVEHIESQTTNTRKTRRLLELLPRRGPRAFRCFLRALDDFSWVRDRLLLDLHTPGPGAEPGPGPGAGAGSTDDRQLPESVLQRVPSDRELSRLASRLGAEWELVLMDLGLSAEALFRCRSDHGLSAHGAALAGLVQWRRSEGRRARVQRLLESLQAADVHPSVLQDALI